VPALALRPCCLGPTPRRPARDAVSIEPMEQWLSGFYLSAYSRLDAPHDVGLGRLELLRQAALRQAVLGRAALALPHSRSERPPPEHARTRRPRRPRWVFSARSLRYRAFIVPLSRRAARHSPIGPIHELGPRRTPAALRGAAVCSLSRESRSTLLRSAHQTVPA